MEPIRSDRNRRLDRRASRRSLGHGEETAGGFARRLEETGEADPPATTGDVFQASGTSPAGVDGSTEKLLDAVHEAGQRLLNERTFSAAQAYREAVQLFLRNVVPDANHVQISESSRGIMSRKRYYLLTDINRSVDRLITGLLQTQDAQFDILGRLEAIRGMLIDLIH